MSFAEIILRIGVAVGGWLIFIGNMLITGVMRQADCDPATDEMWRGTLSLGVLAIISMLVVSLGLHWRKELRPLAAIGGLMFLYALPSIWLGLLGTTFGDASLCHITNSMPEGFEAQNFPPTGAERAWPVVHLAAGLIALLQITRFFRAPKAESDTISVE